MYKGNKNDGIVCVIKRFLDNINIFNAVNRLEICQLVKVILSKTLYSIGGLVVSGCEL